MTTILIVILFILLFFSFYFMALLYTKVSKFDDLEKKQRKLMDEMDNSIGAYLTELRDENNRLLDELAERSVVRQEAPYKTEEKNAQLVKSEEVDFALKPTLVPKNIALQSYQTQRIQKEPTENEIVDQRVENNESIKHIEETDDRTRAIRLHEAGESIEEIAKVLGKGKTEIELILKFK